VEAFVYLFIYFFERTILKFEEVSSTPLEALERTDTCDWLGVTRDVDETLHLRRNAVMTGSTDIPANASLDVSHRQYPVRFSQALENSRTGYLA